MLATKPRKCAKRGCKNTFIQYRSFERYCVDCATEVALAKVAQKKRADKVVEKKADRVKKESLKRRADYIAEAQQAFNLWVRTRDRLAGHACISSGKPLDWSGNAVDAGHFRSRGSAPHLKFDERNCHSQTKYENRYASGNVSGYRIGLIARIGLEAVEALEADQTPRKYSVADLQEIKKKYTAMAKQLKDAHEQS